MTNGWDVLAKGMIHVSGGVEQNGIRFHLTPQNSMEFKYNELFISGFFSFYIFLLFHYERGGHVQGLQSTF